MAARKRITLARRHELAISQLRGAAKMMKVWAHQIEALVIPALEGKSLKPKKQARK